MTRGKLCVKIETIAPPSYRELIWETFFTTRGRGVSLETHFPRLDHEDANRWYALAFDGDKVIGGVCVDASLPEKSLIASVGLVCVGQSYRRKGISKSLMHVVTEHARLRGYVALRLWTSTPEVYRGLGFETADTAVFGYIEKPTYLGTDQLVLPEQSQWPSAQDCRRAGLPPFAKSATTWKASTATVVTIDDGTGSIVAEWEGATVDVVDLMKNVLPLRSRLNALRNDTLPRVLKRFGWKCMLKDVNLQMILPLNTGLSTRQLAAMHPLRVLDRI
jgi:GNAT superfamily N-acetyltransferase